MWRYQGVLKVEHGRFQWKRLSRIKIVFRFSFSFTIILKLIFFAQKYIGDNFLNWNSKVESSPCCHSSSVWQVFRLVILRFPRLTQIKMSKRVRSENDIGDVEGANAAKKARKGRKMTFYVKCRCPSFPLSHSPSTWLFFLKIIFPISNYVSSYLFMWF